MKPKVFPILENCIETGVSRGYYKAHKHNESPTPEEVIAHIEAAVMAAIYEYFTIDTEE